MLQQLNVIGDSWKQIHTCVKQKGTFWAQVHISIHQWHSNIHVDVC